MGTAREKNIGDSRRVWLLRGVGGAEDNFSAVSDCLALPAREKLSEELAKIF